MANRVCPWWIGYLLMSPLRRLFQKPERVLEPYIEPDMTVLDVGCGMGFFSIPMAKMVGPNGRVICVDVQEKMINSLIRRARKAGVLDRIDTRITEGDDLKLMDVKAQVDFILAFSVLHEVPNAPIVLKQLASVLTSKGRMLVSEPSGHISSQEFEETLSVINESGFSIIEHLKIPKSRSVLCRLV